MTTLDTHPTVQAVRRVYENDHSTNSSITPTETIYLVCHPDPSLGKDILLWDDILAAFKDDVVHVRSGAVVLPFLKNSDFKNLDPLRISAVPGVTLDVIVRAQFDTAKELSLESLQKALPDIPQENNKSNSNSHSAATVTAIATVSRRNPVGGHVEEAMQNYTHIDNPATSPQCRGPQAVLQGQAASKRSDIDIQKPPTTTRIINSISNSNSYPGTPQELPLASSEVFEGTMMKARLGDMEAQYSVGECYQYGRGIRQDYQAAMDWFLKAAEQGHPDAQNDIGYLYQHGQGVPQDYVQAMDWYLKSAEQVFPIAQYNIGWLYEKALGVPQDYVEAMRWYQRAAAQGYASAQNNIAFLYRSGFGVPKDYAQAIEWYKKAADQGHATAQHNIGCLYERGEGVPKDKAKAMGWYKKAADGGHFKGKERLDELERQGYKISY